ncbi:3-hydroxyacyl-CoA dehydrogenase family protein [Mycobacterium ostraviense]|uniref:3-hydroxybutyryl-CoA dehydrogenase n=1 Tax=Mycobacterium ostraviense TaxID=2738409 RepID=A0A164E8X2_9MYCO|nr:3-hydroxyacyl-CoA dehydrogenase family protein [Mycobacterium ostraviense]KZS67183.1 3-hydroxybutyryl-CoA dehydrogenase [Mycobacterium ostraviense]UGT90115.1 3-hydroxyacyl-CoA dehydrogenase family protein [Mycobacterium ostraviense]
MNTDKIDDENIGAATRHSTSYAIPADVEQRPVLVVGAGTLGARIALMFALGGSAVRIYNRTPDRAESAKRFVAEQLPHVRDMLAVTGPAGTVEVVTPLEDAVAGTWLIIESVAEDLAIKRPLLAAIDEVADQDAIVATNSSSYPSSQMADAVKHPERLLNIHFLMPPLANSVELMSCGTTDSAIIDALKELLPRYRLTPFEVRRESVGFIFNRIWAAIKREALMVVQEGVATPEDVDRIFQDVFRSPAGPFRMMDQIGLDVVLDVEEHYAQVRDDIPEGPRLLLREYLARGDLGVKSGRGFYSDYDAVL